MAFSTEKGRNWLLKALDPSMTSIDVDGVPDMSVDNVIMLKYNSQFQVSAPSYIKPNQTWNADIYLFPHPVLFGTCLKYGSGWKLYDSVKKHNDSVSFTDGTSTISCKPFELTNGNIIVPDSTSMQGEVEIVERQNFLNTQVAASEYASVQAGGTIQVQATEYQKRCKTLRENVDGLRIAYGSVTLIPNVSSLFDAGVMVATQQAIHKEFVDMDCPNDAGINPEQNNQVKTTNPEPNRAGVIGQRTDMGRIGVFDSNDFPTFENAVNNPHMLSTRFKNGIYMPYKIMNAQVHPFRSTSNNAFFSTRAIPTKYKWIKNSTDTQAKYATEVTYEPIIDQGGDGIKYAVTENPQDPSNPEIFTGSVYDSFKMVESGESGICDLNFNQMKYGQVGIDMVGSNVMCICIRGLSQQATFSLVFRMGFEARVSAGTNYSMFKYVSPNYDEQALRSYQNVVRQSKDAYVGDLEGSPRLRQALSSLIGIEPNTDDTGEMPGFVGSIGV